MRDVTRSGGVRKEGQEPKKTKKVRRCKWENRHLKGNVTGISTGKRFVPRLVKIFFFRISTKSAYNNVMGVGVIVLCGAKYFTLLSIRCCFLFSFFFWPSEKARQEIDNFTLFRWKLCSDSFTFTNRTLNGRVHHHGGCSFPPSFAPSLGL